MQGVYWVHTGVTLLHPFRSSCPKGLPNRLLSESFKSVLRAELEKAMAPHSSTLAWKIPWTEGPGGLQSMGSRRVGPHGPKKSDWATSLYFSLSCIGEGNGNPLQCSGLENPRDGGAWWAAVYGIAQSRTRLKRLSSSKGWIFFQVHFCLIMESWGISKV